MIRPRNWLTEGDKEAYPYFTSHCARVMQITDIDLLLDAAYSKINEGMVNFICEGSGWIINHVNFVDIHIANYTPLKGSSYLPLPLKLASTKSIINVQNSDNKCFLWAVLSALHPADDHVDRVAKYEQYEESLNMGDLKFPMAVTDIPKFEKLNSLAINLFGYEKVIFPIHISPSDNPINILLISDGETQHYCWIKNFNKLMHSNTKHVGKAFYCMYCMHRFSSKLVLEKHGETCKTHGPQNVKFPSGSNAFLSFKNYCNKLSVPYTIYADFESTIEKIDDQVGMKTQRVAEHRPASFSYVIVGPEGTLHEPPFIYRGVDCVKVFLEHMKNKSEEIGLLMQANFPMNLTDAEEADFQASTVCHICEEPLRGESHRDHCHMTGKYRGAAHPGCNLNYKYKGFIPVVLHNLRGYDSHLIMQEIGQFKDSNIECIANNFEKYISFSLDNLRFIDSLQFMSESLEQLVANLVKSGKDKFGLMSEYFPADKLDYVLAKGHFPYEYFDSLDRLQETELPPQTAFWSSLTNSGITDQDYEHAQTVWSAFNMKNFGEYHDLYLQTDVLLLADVFQNFRAVCQKCYGLDPCHYFTAPGLAWDAALKKSKVTLDLLTDPDMFMFFEEGTRGGVSMISNRYAKANNSYLPDFKPSEPQSHILYLDANNLYGWAMSQALPVGGFKWVKQPETLDVTSVPDDGDIGYILEVDLTYPESLHDLHSDYPLAPESMAISEDMLSPFSAKLLSDFKMKHTNNIKKLVPNLNDKRKYILHYRNLKFYLAQGMILTKIHRAVEFRQSPWLKTYIDFNTAQRTAAITDFEKNFYKLMINAVFGKTMENLRKRRNVKLVQTQKKLEKLSASPAFGTFKIFNEDLVGVEMHKTSLYLNRPIYVGFSVLDISKILMYDFYYNTLKVKYGDRVKLLFTDTDSLTVQIFTEDVYSDMQSFSDQLDTSDYPTDHPLYSAKNKKVIGKMKDELFSVPIISYVGLRAKMYSIQPLSGPDKKTAKGVSRSVVRTEFHHADYERVLFKRKPKIADMSRIQSYDHQLYSLRIQKLGLSAADDKRHILPNGYDTLAHGHYKLRGDGGMV